jgi:tRNA-2-methylthio-N6-dimethylallyladenosine synthase
LKSDAHKNRTSTKPIIFIHMAAKANEADSVKQWQVFLNSWDLQKQLHETESDVIILNTCAIRENAENRIWGELGRLKAFKRQNPDLF